ncbi:MAG: hypothetical protein JXB36_06345, partial [Gammaproteobacteria bacterium]|nr:hypothetical protein [Gammaproteobacteria bacterium]
MDERIPPFKARLEREVLSHPVITANPYTRWFSRGEFSAGQAQQFLIQFSVFSNQFLLAQLQKVLNADTLDQMRASKEILANEIGVGFRGPPGRAAGHRGDVSARSAGAAGTSDGADTETELGSLDGSIEGGTFHFRAAHFELLVRMARQFGLGFGDLGKRRFGTRSTLFFCDELLRLYGNEDYCVSAAASWAVENWAAAGFWDELVQGWARYAERRGGKRLDMAFFTWHARLEANHAR